MVMRAIDVELLIGGQWCQRKMVSEQENGERKMVSAGKW
jgi:hypothetical protein